MHESIIFYFFSFFAILSTIIMISIKNNFYSFMFLIVTFVCGVMLCFLLNAEYIALIITFIKIVSIAILFMFLFMSIKTKNEIHTTSINFKKLLLIILLISIFLQLIFSYTKSNNFLKNLSQSDNLENSNIINLIGKILYTDYILLFHITGGILCISMIGVSIIVNRYMHNIKLRNKVNMKSPDDLILNNINSSKNTSIR